MAQATSKIDLVRELVYHALNGKPGTSARSQYSMLVKELSGLRRKVERDTSTERVMMLSSFINVIRDYVSLLREHQHDTLLTEVMSIKLWTTAPTVRGAVLDLISTLVVVNTAFTHTCLRQLVSSLLPPAAPAAPTAVMGAWAPSEEEVMVQSAITGALIKVLGLVPTAPVSLMQLVSSHMPHKLRDRHTQCLYLSAVMALAEAPAGRPVRDALLATTVEHLLALDVEIRWEDIVEGQSADTAEEHVEDVGEDADEIFQLEGMNELDLNATQEQLEQARQERLAAQQQQEQAARGGWEGAAAAAGAAGTAGAEAAAPHVDETADKLDSLMELAFAHLERRCSLPSAGGPAQAWSALMSCFERTILNTHRSKFSQFLVFFMCHKHPEPCVKLFVDFLMVRLQDTRLPPITRSACAAYLASFLARSAAVHPSLVLECVGALTRFAEQYNEGAGSGGLAPGAGDACLTTKHQVFYASIQAILYVLCYHLDTLLTHQHHHHHHRTPPVADALRALLRERVLPLLSHPLQPLRVCLPSVVKEFATQLTAHGFTDLGALQQAVTQVAPGTSSSSNTSQRPLEMFFPFDPYLLQRSSRYLDLTRSYVRWRKGAARTQRATTNASESDAEDEEEGAQQAGMSDEDDGELDLDASSSSSSGNDSSSDTTEDESNSLRGTSMDPMASAGTHMMLSRPKQGGLPPRGVQHHSSRGRGASPVYPGHLLPRPSNGLNKHPHSRGSPSMGMGTSYGDPNMMMGTSYGTGALSSMGDGTPTMGSSPVVVEYMASTEVGHRQGASPMQMTPAQYGGHMEMMAQQMPGRLAARTR